MARRPDKSISKLFDRVVEGLRSSTQPVTTKDNNPDKPEGWMSTAEMGDVFVGDGMKHNRTLKKFIEIKKQQLVNSGITPENAESIVKEKWVRECKVGVIGNRVLCASPEAITELENLKLIEKKDRLLPKPEGWLSNCSNEHTGNTGKRKKIYLDFAEEKKQELVKNDGKTAKEADKIVYEKWVGIYSNVNQPALCISPDGAKILEERGLLVKRDKNKILKKEGSFVDNVGSTGISPKSFEERANKSKGAQL